MGVTVLGRSFGGGVWAGGGDRMGNVPPSLEGSGGRCEQVVVRKVDYVLPE